MLNKDLIRRQEQFLLFLQISKIYKQVDCTLHFIIKTLGVIEDLVICLSDSL